MRVYVDGSASMVGFAGAGEPGNTPYLDVIDSLGQLAAGAEEKAQTRYFRLGDQIVELQADQALVSEALHSRDFYLCRGPLPGENCSNQVSRTPLVIERMAADPSDSISIFLSDLWFSDDQITAAPGVALRSSLASILRTRDVAIYGFRAPYGAALADLPSGDRSVRPSELPFYLLIAAPPARMREIQRNFERPGSRWIRDNLGGERLRFALFSTTSVIADQSGDSSFRFETNDPHPGISERRVWRALYERIPDQFVIDSGRIREQTTGPVWTWPDSLRPGSVWQGDFDSNAYGRRIRNQDGCKVLDPIAISPAITARGGREGGFRFELTPAVLAEELGRGEWLVVGEVRRRSLRLDNPMTEWMRQWSFDGSIEGEKKARSHAGFFPTMNLSEFARLMEYSVEEAAKAEDKPLAGFATVIRIE